MRPRPMAGMWWAAAKNTPRLNATWNLQNKSGKITKMLQFPYISEIFLNFVKWNIEVFNFSFI